MGAKGVPAPVRVNNKNRAQVKRIFLEEIAKGATQSYACQVAGCSTRVISRWKVADEKFAVAYEDARMKKLDVLLEAAFNMALDPEVPAPQRAWMLMFQIKQLDPSFRDNTKLEVAPSPGLAKSLTQLAKLAEQEG